MYQELNSKSLRQDKHVENSLDHKFQRFLFNTFSGKTGKAIYYAVIDTITFFAKIGVYLSLPFKFVQFFFESYRRKSQKP